MRIFQLMVTFVMVTGVFFQEFPDKSVIWTAHDQTFLYSHSLEEWTSAQITPKEFGQNISVPVLSGMQSAYGVASDTSNKHLVLSDKLSQTLVIVDLSPETLTANYFHIGTSQDIGQVTIDWLGHNVYWADTGYGWIAMKELPASIVNVNSLDPNFRVVVDEYLEKPTGLVVHPEKFYLFWTDSGETKKIERSDLTGGNRKVIIWHSLITPTTLSIDQSADRLYWSDPGRGTIEYSDFDGNSRKILLSNPDVNYYGIAVFRDSLIYTAPAYNRTGYVSLKENIEGKHIQAMIDTDVTMYHVLVYASELQKTPQNNMLCDTVDECDQMCLYMEQDAGFTCLCNDGYDLVAGNNCTAEERVLERHLVFTYKSSICAVPITVLGLPISNLLPIHCDIVTEETEIIRFAIDMNSRIFFYTNGTAIYKQRAFQENRELLYVSDGTITDMDYNWKTKQLFWAETGDGLLYFFDVNDESHREPDKKKLSDSDVTNIAVDPHNRNVFWITQNSDGYMLKVWDTVQDEIQLIHTSLLVKPTDLEYDRLKDRIMWIDDEGHFGMINTNGTQERKYDRFTSSGEKRHAITVYKNFLLGTTAENRQFDIIYELEPDVKMHMNLNNAYDGPVLDLHVYESSLQPSNLEPCEADNGGCEHICLPGNTQKCACDFGYFLDSNERSCKTVALTEKFSVILDGVHERLYQIDLATGKSHIIEIDQSNKPTRLAFDSSRNEVIWVDANKRAVKKKKIGSTNEIAVWTGVDGNAALTVDVSTGNIYISTGNDVIVVGQIGDKITIIDSPSIQGTIRKIAVMPVSGLMAWLESGDTLRIVIANMDGSNIRPITVNMKGPEDISFDLEDEKNLYWCDSVLDKIERIDTQSLSTTMVYENRGLRPIAIDIVGDILYFVPQKQRKIIQLNKNTGLGQMDVFESPLIGSLDNFFFARNVEGHKLCKNCNGGCSTLCLPIGKSKRCACADGISLKDDELLCQYVDVCPHDSFTPPQGLNSLTECCFNLPDALCKPMCQSGYVNMATGVKCISGKWNVSLDWICKVLESEPLPIPYIAAGAGGGAALLVIVTVVVVCIYRRNQRKGTPDAEENFTPNTTHARVHDYDDANGILSPDPPEPARRQPEPEVYDYLDENGMIDVSKLQVALPTKDAGNKKMTRENSTSSGRYSKLPEAGYLSATYERKGKEEPQPDYESDYIRDNTTVSVEGPDGYLTASSIGGGSLRDASNGSFNSVAPRTNFSDSRRHRDNPYAVHYSIGNSNNIMDVALESGRGHGFSSSDKRNSGHRSASESMINPRSYGYCGHI